MRLYLLSAIAPLLLVGACATPGGGSSDRRAATTPAGDEQLSAGVSAYGMFLAGEVALNEGRNADAAQFFDQARAPSGGEAMVADRAFTAALLSGDVDRAAAIAPTGPDAAEGTKRLGRLVVAVDAMANGKYKDAQVLLASESIAFPHKAAAALLQPWAAAGAGDLDGSLARPQVRGDRAVDYFGQIGQAFLYERAKRYDEAETDFKAVASINASETAALAYGGFLERRGRRVDAIALYQSYLARDPSSTAIMLARQRAQAGKVTPSAPTLREGAAQALLAPAATMMEAKQMSVALAYLRMVLRLDPQRDEGWVMVGDIMQASNDVAAARAAYGHPAPGSTEFAAAQSKLAWTYQAAGDKAMAIKVARAAAASGDTNSRVNLADLLRSDDQWAESAEVLTGVIKEAQTPDWRLLYARGIDYQQMGRWADAQTDLEAALKDHPDEPELLNFLGYSWIDQGQRLPEALEMVKKAVGAEPRSGAITNSLGWAYYRLGDYKQAVEKLEQAVELEAGDPEINDHLGDAYWRVGRRDEALFQWRRVLTLKPDDKIRDRAMTKLASGLGPAAAAPKVAGK